MDELIHFDQQLFLMLNGSESTFLDNIFLAVTATRTWIPLGAMLLFVLFRNTLWRQALLFAACFALVIFIADRFSSGVCKPYFHRFRPSHEPVLEGLVDLVNNKRGGRYGFFSSHAANMFGVITFVCRYIRHRLFMFSMLTMALLSCYSRIYLGFHYPGDILVGAIFGIATGLACYALFCVLCRRFLPATGSSTPYVTANSFRSTDMNILVATFWLTMVVVVVSAAF